MMETIAYIAVYLVGYVVFYLIVRHSHPKGEWKISDRTFALLTGVAWFITLFILIGFIIHKNLNNESKAKW